MQNLKIKSNKKEKKLEHLSKIDRYGYSPSFYIDELCSLKKVFKIGSKEYLIRLNEIKRMNKFISCKKYYKHLSNKKLKKIYSIEGNYFKKIKKFRKNKRAACSFCLEEFKNGEISKEKIVYTKFFNIKLNKLCDRHSDMILDLIK